SFRHRQLPHNLAGIPHTVHMRYRLECDAAQPFLNTDPAQHFHRIWQHLDARADSSELVRLFVDPYVGSDAPQRDGSGQAPHAGSDDGDGHFLLDHFSYPSAPAATRSLSISRGCNAGHSRRSSYHRAMMSRPVSFVLALMNAWR